MPTKSQILSGLDQTNKFIMKEECRSPDLRPLDVKQRLDFYYIHRQKLQKMLDDLDKG